MSAVWKYTLAIVDEQQVEMPEGAELLHVAEQYGTLALWARVNPSEHPLVKREIVIRGTGHQIVESPFEDYLHVATVVTAGGDLVWHVFDGGVLA